ncbi:MAG: hypothetical protein HY237_06085 [Acidobacteria bacterium]|nr:hypothetical protein [Acidobacteriota bacterium]
MWLGITLVSWLTITAIALGPILALIIQGKLNRMKEQLDRKLHIFRVLMATRATRLAPNHVEALNAIEVEFYGDKEENKKVVAAWRNYSNALAQPFDDNTFAAWQAKHFALFLELLLAMAEALKYKFEKVTLEREVYYPKYFGELTIDQENIRKSVVKVLGGETPISVRLRE